MVICHGRFEGNDEYMLLNRSGIVHQVIDITKEIIEECMRQETKAEVKWIIYLRCFIMF